MTPENSPEKPTPDSVNFAFGCLFFAGIGTLVVVLLSLAAMAVTLVCKAWTL